MGDYPSGRSAAAEHVGRVPDEEEMMTWISQVVEQGIRRPGYAADSWTEQWARQRFQEIGLNDVRLEPLDTPIWRPRSATFEIWPADRPEEAVTFTGSALPYSAPSEGTRARLAYQEDPDVDLSGSIAVQELTFTPVRQSDLRARVTEGYDPEGIFDDFVQTVPFDLRRAMAFDKAIAAGATAYIGLLTGVPWETHGYYWPIDARRRSVPAIWLSGNDGRRIRELMAAGPCAGRVTSDASITDEITHNVIGTLPGVSDHWVIVGSHHDGPWASAVEDGSGIALVLAQAKYWASVPADQRPHNMLFMLTSGHMAGVAGTKAFIEKHQDMLPDVVLEVHLEHAARRCEVVDGKLVPTADPEIRWWYTTQTPALEKLVAESIAAEDLARSWIMPPTTFERMPLTDGAYFYPAGVPMVNFSSVPMYLLDPADTLDKVHEPSLVPITKAVARMIDGTANCTPATFRVSGGAA
jgi:hypothetical protein